MPLASADLEERMTSPARRLRWPTLRQWFWISVALSASSLAALAITWTGRTPDPAVPLAPRVHVSPLLFARPAPPPRPLTECDRVIRVVNELGRVLSSALQRADSGAALGEAAARLEKGVRDLESLRLADAQLAELVRSYTSLLGRFGLAFEEVILAVASRNDRRVLRSTNALHTLVLNEGPRIQLLNDYCRDR